MNSKIVDLWFLTECYVLAKNSPDKSTQNGAILINSKSLQILGKGFNTFPNGVKILSERLERPKKYGFTGHAEERAIKDALIKGYDVRGSTLYCPWFACDGCGRDIVDFGIREVIGWGGVGNLMTPVQKLKGQADWKTSIRDALEMFDDAGINYRWVKGPLLEDLEILFYEKKVKLNDFA
ncbi:MAG: deaminase [archaeon]|nr:deaminase [archaeon]